MSDDLTKRPSDLPKDCQWVPRDNTEPRVETGPLAFGRDWPGVFIRGDNAGYYAMQLGLLLDGKDDGFAKMALRGLRDDLAGCILGPARQSLTAPTPVTPEALVPLGFVGSKSEMLNRQHGVRCVIEFDRGKVDGVQIGLERMPHSLWPETMADVHALLSRLSRPKPQ